eukprot:1140624-Pelagomonas_calceolata.AAC.4
MGHLVSQGREDALPILANEPAISISISVQTRVVLRGQGRDLGNGCDTGEQERRKQRKHAGIC